jgi:hypothetical protein
MRGNGAGVKIGKPEPATQQPHQELGGVVAVGVVRFAANVAKDYLRAKGISGWAAKPGKAVLMGRCQQGRGGFVVACLCLESAEIDSEGLGGLQLRGRLWGHRVRGKNAPRP